jgi:hypothetical protein
MRRQVTNCRQEHANGDDEHTAEADAYALFKLDQPGIQVLFRNQFCPAHRFGVIPAFSRNCRVSLSVSKGTAVMDVP